MAGEELGEPRGHGPWLLQVQQVRRTRELERLDVREPRAQQLHPLRKGRHGALAANGEHRLGDARRVRR